MADKNAAGAAGRAPAADRPDNIRNVVLVGPSGSGKTTLVEQLLVAAGTIPRAGPGRGRHDGVATSTRPSCASSAPSVSAARPARCRRRQGQPARHPRVRRLRGRPARRAARRRRRAVRRLRRRRRRRRRPSCSGRSAPPSGMPRAVVVTKLDKERADFDDVVAICQRVFGEGVLPLYLPMHADDGTVAGLIGLLSQQVYDYSAGERAPSATPTPSTCRSSRTPAAPSSRGSSPSPRTRPSWTATSPARTSTSTPSSPTSRRRSPAGSFYPVLAGRRSPAGFGTAELLELIMRGLPVAAGAPAPRGHLAGRRARASRWPATPTARCAPRSSRPRPTPTSAASRLVRVFSGTLRPDAVVHVSGHFAARPRARGPRRRRAGRRAVLAAGQDAAHRRRTAIAGDIVAVAKLVARRDRRHALATRTSPLLVEPWVMPDPLLPVAIVAHSKADDDKLAQGLGRLVAEDPTMRLERNPETHQLVLWCMGEAHVDVLLDRLRNRYGVAVDSVPLRVSLRETFAGPSKGHGRLSSSPAATASSPSATSRSSRCPRARASSSSTRSSAAPSRASSSRAWRRACAPRWRGGRRRLPARRHPGDPRRRQGALGRLLRHGVPAGRRARAQGGGRGGGHRRCSSRSTEITRARGRRVRRARS